jgi:hypothetical protein
MSPFKNWTKLLTVERLFTKLCSALDMTGRMMGVLLPHKSFSNIFGMADKNGIPEKPRKTHLTSFPEISIDDFL